MMPILFEEVACNICGSNDFDVFLVREDLSTNLPGLFRLVRCKQCGLVYQNPRPTLESWDEIYPESYDQYAPFDASARFRKFHFLARYGTYKRAKLLSRYSPGGNICDIGCSTGDFLYELRKDKKWEVYGVEPKKEAAETARKYGLNVEQARFDEAVFPGTQFDAITLWNVIEHLHDPMATIRIIHQRLNPGGILIFNTPSLDSWDAKLFGRYWIGFELPRHLFIFSEKSIRMLLGIAGFEWIDRQCFYGQHAAAMSSARFFLRSKTHKRLGFLEEVLFSMPARILFAPLFFAQDKFKKSSQITIVSRKAPAHE